MYVFWDPCARANLHQQKRALKLCSATLSIKLALYKAFYRKSKLFEKLKFQFLTTINPRSTKGFTRTRSEMPLHSESNWNLVFEERGKPDYPEKNLLKQSRETTTNSTHIWRRVRKSNPGHIAGRRALSPLRQPCSPKINQFRYIILLQSEALGNKPHKLCIYSLEPPTEVYYFRLNFHISKLVYW